jgi:integrase
MSVYKRGNVWWYRFKFKGQTISKGASRNKDIAARLEREHRRSLELNQGGLTEIAKPKRCSLALQEVRDANEVHWAPKTRELHKNSQKHLVLVFGPKLLSEITPDDIGKYQGKRHKAGASNRTVNIEIGLLRLALKKAKLWANLADDVKMLKERSDIGRELSDDEQHRLLTTAKASASRSLYPALVTSIHTGLRSKELRLLRWRQVDLMEGFIMVGKSKTQGGEGRLVPLSQTALQTLQEWRSQFPSALPVHYVFPRESYGLFGEKGTFGGKVMPYETFPDQPVRSFATAWRTAKKLAGVECRWHDLRHSFVSQVAAGGASDQTLKALAGWMSAKMIERYSHSRNQAKRSAVSVLDRPVSGVYKSGYSADAQIPDKPVSN